MTTESQNKTKQQPSHYQLKNHYHCHSVLSYRHILMIHRWFMKIYWTKGWLHPQNTFLTVKNLMLRITSAVQMYSDAELLTKYLYKPNFAGYYSQNIHSSKHMVLLKVMFLLPKNAGLITIGSWVYRMPWLGTEQLFYTESSVWSYKEMRKNAKTYPGDGAKFAKAVSGHSFWGWRYCDPPEDYSQPYLLWENQGISGCSST